MPSAGDISSRSAGPLGPRKSRLIPSPQELIKVQPEKRKAAGNFGLGAGPSNNAKPLRNFRYRPLFLFLGVGRPSCIASQIGRCHFNFASPGI